MSQFIIAWKSYFPYYKRNLKLAFPVILTHIGTALVGFFDTMMIGHYSTSALAAVSVSNAVFFSIMVLTMGIIMGITPLISVQTGKKDTNANYTLAQYKQSVSAILHTGLLITIALSMICFLILSLCLRYFEYFDQEPIVNEEVKPYFFLINLSIFPFLLFCLCKQFFEGIGNTTVAMVITLFVNALNVFLNWIFIYGHLGFEAMGAKGAGLATLFSRLCMPCLFLITILGQKKWREFIQLFSLKQLQLPAIKKIIDVGLPIGIQTFFETILFTLSFIFVGWINKESLAAHNIANQICDMTFMLVMGIGAATTIRVSYQLGCKNWIGLKMATNASIHLVLFVNTIGAMIMICFRYFIPALFTSDPIVFNISAQLLLCAGILQYADGMQAVGAAILRGLTDVKVPMIFAFISYIIVAFPIGLFLTFAVKMGAVGMWIGFIVGLFFAALLFHYRIHKNLKKIFLTSD